MSNRSSRCFLPRWATATSLLSQWHVLATPVTFFGLAPRAARPHESQVFPGNACQQGAGPGVPKPPPCATSSSRRLACRFLAGEPLVARDDDVAIEGVQLHQEGVAAGLRAGDQRGAAAPEQ